MMRKAFIVALAALTAPAQADDGNLYDRVGAKLAADPVLAASLGKPGEPMQSIAWMSGAWEVTATVQGGAQVRDPERGVSEMTPTLNGTWLEMRDTYPKGIQDMGFLGYSPATRRWTSIGLDSAGNAVVTSGDWKDQALVLEGDAVVIGVRAHLRQTLRRQGHDAFTLVNEERAADGRWHLLDTYRYVRK